MKTHIHNGKGISAIILRNPNICLFLLTLNLNNNIGINAPGTCGRLDLVGF